MPLSSWDTGVQKINERKSQNSILSLLRAFSLSETITNFKNELKSAASLILTFSLPILQHYHIHQNAPTLGTILDTGKVIFGHFIDFGHFPIEIPIAAEFFLWEAFLLS